VTGVTLLASPKKTPFGRSYATTQAAKVAPFAAGNEADVRKSAAGDFFQSTRVQ
jgi:hypothetical protein